MISIKMNLILICIVLSVSLLELGTCFIVHDTTADPKSAIIGGYPIANDSVPYHVILRCNGRYICGGALISNQHVLTAAHCLKKNCHLTVTAGTINQNVGGFYIPAKSLHIHPNFGNKLCDNDIAVIKLEIPFAVSKTIGPIKLSTRPPRQNELVQVTGFGRVEYSTYKMSDIMKTYRTKLFNYEHCSKIFQVSHIGPGDICDRPIKGHGICQGDSGSPLVDEGMQYLIGIVSRGYSCAQGQPNIYSSVYHHLPFIRRHLNL